MSWDGAICALDTRNTNASSRWTPFGRGVGCGAALVRVECFSVGVDCVRSKDGGLCWARARGVLHHPALPRGTGPMGESEAGGNCQPCEKAANFFFFGKFLDWFRFIARRHSASTLGELFVVVGHFPYKASFGRPGRDTLARGFIPGLRASIAWARSVNSATSLSLGRAQFRMASTTASDVSAPATKPKLHGRAFYESIGSPKYIVAPMVDQSEFVSRHPASFCSSALEKLGTNMPCFAGLAHAVAILLPRVPTVRCARILAHVPRSAL